MLVKCIVDLSKFLRQLWNEKEAGATIKFLPAGASGSNNTRLFQAMESRLLKIHNLKLSS